MLFSSAIFIAAFFPLFFIIYYCMPNRTGKNIALLIASLFFYAWGKVVYLPLLILAALLGWLGGLWIDAEERKNSVGGRRCALTVSLVLLIGMLGVFKYAGFFVENLNIITGASLDVPEIELPIGISFFTFQIVSYVIDVYRGEVKAQRRFWIVAVYLCAFPQLIAGPVVRYSTVERELTERSTSLDDVYAGLRRFIVGLGKKILIANTMAVAADGIFSYTPAECGAAAAWIGAVAYTLQIFFDFSGYSDMAIGMGRMMGFHYLENFNDPYIAVSVTDFWRRWHISMSSFFRDYVYIPLGGNRVSRGRWVFNIMVVWALTGLWHGASWNFVVWGLYYGVLLILEKLLWGRTLEKLPVVRRVYTLLIVIIGWVIFRSETLTYAVQMVSAMFGGYGLGTGKVTWTMILERSSVGGVFVIAAIFGILLSAGLGRRITEKLNAIEAPSARKTCEGVLCVLSFAMLIVSFAAVASGAYNPFIYFRF